MGIVGRGTETLPAIESLVFMVDGAIEDRGRRRVLNGELNDATLSQVLRKRQFRTRDEHLTLYYVIGE